MPESKEAWFFQDHKGRQTGPLRESSLVGLYRSGQIRQDTLVWSKGMIGWRPFDKVFSSETKIRSAPKSAATPPPLPSKISSAASGFSSDHKSTATPSLLRQSSIYAGFWKRLAAYIIDFMIIIIPSLIAGLLLGIGQIALGNSDPETLENAGNAAGLLVMWLYFALMESSTKQATVGKMALGIKVTDADGHKISFGRATGRHFGKIISWFTLGIGFIMIAFTEKKQGLHDLLANCLVVDKAASPITNRDTHHLR